MPSPLTSRREFLQLAGAAATASLLPASLRAAPASRPFEVSASLYAWDLHDEGIERIERAVLPFRHFFEDRIGDRRDQVHGDINAIDLAKVPLNLANRHAARVHRYDLLIKARKPALILGD